MMVVFNAAFAAQHGKRVLHVLVTQLATEGLSLFRNILIARWLGAESLGGFIIAVAVLRFAEMSTDLGLERFIVQHNRSNARFHDHDVRMMASVHGCAAGRGVLLSVLMIVAAWPLAHWLSEPSLKSMIVWLAFVPLARGFMHYGHRAVQRKLEFGHTMHVEGLAAFVSAIALFVVLLAQAGIEWIAATVALQAFLVLILSHIAASHPYRFAVHGDVFQSILRFGVPLIINGWLLYAVMYGDRLVVAGFTRLEDVALFAVILQCAILPVQMAGRLMLGLGLPYLAKAREVGDLSADVLSRCLFALLFCASLYVAIGIWFGPFLIEAVFALPTVDAGMVVVFLFVAAGIRLLRQAYSTLFQAYGDTLSPVKANLWRLLALPAGIAVMLVQPGLEFLCAIIAVGEFIALIAMLVMAVRHPELPHTHRFSSLRFPVRGGAA
tara:strand:- start:4914 stop:6227 length:1314 start_codon:yes stop_codon:yes gene_type:complete